MAVPPLYFFYSLVNGHGDCFLFWTIMNNNAMNIYIQDFVLMHVFICLGYKLRSGLPGS